MRLKPFFLCLITSMFVSPWANAQYLIAASAKIKPLQAMFGEKEKIDACGAQITMIGTSPPNDWMNVIIFNLHDRSTLSFKELINRKHPASLGDEVIQGAWIRFGNDNAVNLKENKIRPDGEIQYEGDAELATKFVIAVAEDNARIQVGISFKRGKLEHIHSRIYSARTTMKNEDREEFFACNREMMERIADTLTEADFNGQAEQILDDGGAVSRCGLSISGVENYRGKAAGNVAVFGILLGIRKFPPNMVGGHASDIDVKRLRAENFTKNDFKRLQVENVWVKSSNSPPTSPRDGTSMRGEDDFLFVRYESKREPFVAVLESIKQRKPIQIGVTVAGRKANKIMFGVVNISDAEISQYTRCFAGLMASEDKNRNPN